MVISAASREKIALEIAKYPKPRGALLPALHLVHAEHGHVSPEAADELAQMINRSTQLSGRLSLSVNQLKASWQNCCLPGRFAST